MDNSTSFNGCPQAIASPPQFRHPIVSTPRKRAAGLLSLGAAGFLCLATGCTIHAYHHYSTFNTTLNGTSGPDWPEDQKMLFEYHRRDNCAALESKRVVLLFHGLTAEQQQLFHFQGNHQAVQIAGDGSSSVSVTCATEKGTVAFHSDYAAGTNTVRFGQQTVRLAQGGCLLLAGEQTVDLRAGRKVVHLTGGKAVVE